ncbi:MAG: hypothetical protein R3C16_02670 [Hyphomonadaceae bacterium]
MGMFIAIPLYVLSFLQTDFWPAFALLLVAPIFHYLYLGPLFAATHGVVAPRQRATATAILLLVINLIGYGLGSPVVGALNDIFAANLLAEATNGVVTLAQCDPRSVAPENAAACASAQGLGLKYALGITILVLAWAGLHLLAGRTLVKDRVSETGARLETINRA